MDARTIEALYREHGHYVLRRARRLLGNDDDAREVLQEVFATLLDRPASFRGDSSITTWLYSATTHGCLNRLRNTKTRARLLESNAGAVVTSGAPASAPSPASSASSAAEATAILRELLARVPTELAEVAIHHYADEMTHEEIARMLGCSRRHVGDLIARLHASLREAEGGR